MKILLGSSGIAKILALVMFLAVGRSRASETVLVTFGGNVGAYPRADLIADNVGNLYGTTKSGGPYGAGVVFELSPPANGSGSWTYKVLYSFHAGKDGAAPVGRLVFDAAGNLYGTTSSGGAFSGGTVFELTPEGGTWHETILYRFGVALGGPSDGYDPNAGLTIDAMGNLYGTTVSGGLKQCEANQGASTAYCGTVFQLKPPSSPGGAWTETLIHRFTGLSDGQSPYSSLTLGAHGELYGTSFGDFFYCQSFGTACGTVFMLVPPKQGSTWTLRTLHAFGINDGQMPVAAVIQDEAGNLYGTTLYGGDQGIGTVFELIPPSAITGAWTESRLYSFSGSDGSMPEGVLTFDNAGNLYSTTAQGGVFTTGTAFKLTPPLEQGGAWTESVLYSFASGGITPTAGLTFGKDGLLFGTLSAAGGKNQGTLFSMTP